MLGQYPGSGTVDRANPARPTLGRRSWLPARHTVYRIIVIPVIRIAFYPNVLPGCTVIYGRLQHRAVVAEFAVPPDFQFNNWLNQRTHVKARAFDIRLFVQIIISG